MRLVCRGRCVRVCNLVILCSDQLIVVVGWDVADERVVVTVAPALWVWTVALPGCGE